MRKVLVLVPVCVVAVSTSAHAGTALDKPPFTATPAELLAAAKTAPAGDYPAVVLRDDHDDRFDARGNHTRRRRVVFVVRTQAGVDDWGSIQWSWSPFYQDKPALRARVVEPDGTVVELDPSAISDAPAVEKSASVFSDRRALEAPLPRLRIGSVVEEEITTADRQPIVSTFSLATDLPGMSVPVASTRIMFSAPAALKAHQVSRALDAKIRPRHEVAGGRESWTFEIGPLAAQDDDESSLPSDVVVEPEVSITTAPSWTAVAQAYRKLLDQKISEGPVALPAELPKTPSRETIAAVVAWLHHQVRYTGIEYGEASNIPWPPAETAKRGYGDCKDKATLLVALLRQAGVRADLALLQTGPGLDIDPKLPGLGIFDHAIVRAKLGAADVWIDATEDLIAPGRLPIRDQGRHALVIADDTADLVTTPRTGGDTVREVRTFEAAEDGPATLTEVSRSSGAYGAEEREWIRDTRADEVRKDLTKYVANEYRANALDHYVTAPPADDLEKPFEITTVATGAHRVFASRSHLDIYLYPGDALDKAPRFLSAKPADSDKPRAHDFAWAIPHTYEIENRIVLPPGYAPPAPEPAQTTKLGSASLTRERKVDGQTLIVTYRFDSGKPRLSPKELDELRSAMRTASDEEVHIAVAHRAWAAFDRGDVKGAIAEAQRLIQVHPKEARHHDELATMYLLAGAGAAARREAMAGTKLEPKNADAFTVQGWILAHDTLGQEHGFDFDRAGAIAAYKKARVLEPKHVGAAAELAGVVERGADGRISWAPADLAAAVEAWKNAYDLAPDDADHRDKYIRALLRAGKAKDAEAIARKAPASDSRDGLLVASVAASDPAAAIGLAGTMRGSDRNQLIGRAGGELMQLRWYAASSALLAEAGMLRDGSAEAKMFRRMTRHDGAFTVGRDPKAAVAGLMLAFLDGHSPQRSAWDEDERRQFLINMGAYQTQLRALRQLEPAVVRDMALSGLDAKIDGKAGGPWRVEAEFFGQKFVVYVGIDGKEARVVGAPDAAMPTARFAHKRLAARDAAGARQIMDWFAADAPKYANSRLPRLWGPGVATDDKSLAVAIAAMAGLPDAASIATLEACATSAADARDICDFVVGAAYAKANRWADLEKHAIAWAARAPKQRRVVMDRITALVELRRYDEADKVAAEHLAADPGDQDVVSERIWIAIRRGTIDEAIKRYEELMQSPGVRPVDRNDYAWYLVAVGRDSKTAVDKAREAFRANGGSASVANTLAAAEAEVGDLKGAIQDVYHTMELRSSPAPEASDLFVVGRVLEQLGLKDDAIATYRQIKQAGKEFPSAEVLAARRLAALK